MRRVRAWCPQRALAAFAAMDLRRSADSAFARALPAQAAERDRSGVLPAWIRRRSLARAADASSHRGSLAVPS